MKCFTFQDRITPIGPARYVAGLIQHSEDYRRIWDRHTRHVSVLVPTCEGIEIVWQLQGPFTLCILTPAGKRGQHRQSYYGMTRRSHADVAELHRGMEISFSRAVQDLWRRA